MLSKLCMNCFSSYRPVEDGSVCPVCGWDNGKAQPQGTLKYQTELASHYVLGRARSANGEGITYCALDTSTQKPVEIREFFPAAIAHRDDYGAVLSSREHNRVFQQYRNDFMDLAKGISRLRELTVVESVIDILEENGTVYTVYQGIPSSSLRRYVADNGGRLTWNETSRLFTPVITALGLISSLGISHLAISPDSLRVTRDGNMLITGFHINAVHRAGGVLDIDLYPGCAAIEQYSAKATCGEVSDVYAVGACMLYALTGKLPVEASQRLEDQRLMISRDILKTMPPFAVTAIANSLQIKQAARTGSFESLRAELTSAPALVDEVEETDAIRRLPPASMDLPRHRRGLPPVVWLIGSLVITLGILIVVASHWLGEQGMSFNDLGNLFNNSQEEEPVEVPNMVNQNFERWQNRVNSGEFNFKLKEAKRDFDPNVAEGSIISQEPLAGETVQPGGTVTVTVSRGMTMRELPDFKGANFAELQAALTQSGFSPVKEEQFDDEVELGYVIGYKDYQPGDSLEYGTAVTVLVSAGPNEEE
ncbi:PASTA domain-containing protein [Acutalibacter intestini]|uniref:PASTA domain-containing protein n=1 Tax=Acutalibacter intestini TaxID=3093659 RepID=UPI002AC8C1F8|nr:PASTA domain-containing protein [Acutalibacter sp. M00204]